MNQYSPALIAARLDDDGTVLLVGRIHIVPGTFGLDDVSVGIDGRHGQYLLNRIEIIEIFA